MWNLPRSELSGGVFKIATSVPFIIILSKNFGLIVVVQLLVATSKKYVVNPAALTTKSWYAG